MSSKILICGASGGVGSTILSQLLALSPSPSLRISSRDPSKLNEFPSNVEIVKGDLSDPTTFPALFHRITKAFIYIQGTDNTAVEVATTAKNAGVRHIVFLSSGAVLGPPSYIGQCHLKVEDAIKSSGLTYTFLRAGEFCTNSINMWGPQIKHAGKISHPFPNSHSTPIANEDIASVAVVALTSSLLDNQAPSLTGPRSLTQSEMIEAINEVRGEANLQRVELVVVSEEQWKENLAKRIPQAVVDTLAKFSKSADGVPQRTSPDFENITGKHGMEFRDWVRVHKEAFCC